MGVASQAIGESTKTGSSGMRLARSRLAQVVEELLRAADRERGDHQHPAALHRVLHGPLQLLGGVLLAVGAVAVGALGHQRGGQLDRLGVLEDRRVVAAEVAGEDDPLAGGLELELADRRAEDVPGAVEGEGDALAIAFGRS